MNLKVYIDHWPAGHVRGPLWSLFVCRQTSFGLRTELVATFKTLTKAQCYALEEFPDAVAAYTEIQGKRVKLVWIR